MESNPWLDTSLEVLELAIEQYYMSLLSSSESDKRRYMRLALIDADDSVELALKAFIEYQAGQKVSENFHDNLKWITANGPKYGVAIGEGLTRKAKFYHNIRNSLYHEGPFFSVPRHYVLDFLYETVNLFQQLFGDDMTTSLEQNHRRNFLLAHVVLEKLISDLCFKNKLKFEGQTELVAVVQQLVESALVDSHMEEAVSKGSDILQDLIPQADSEDITSSLGDVSVTLLERIRGLRKIS